MLSVERMQIPVWLFVSSLKDVYKRQNKAYTEKQLDETIEKNGIHILKDSYTIINDEIILLGRDDACWP